MINNICHFVFGMNKQSEEFLFTYYIAVYSAYLINNPDTIYFYYHYEPYGTWYYTLKLIPNLKLVKIDIPIDHHHAARTRRRRHHHHHRAPVGNDQVRR